MSDFSLVFLVFILPALIFLLIISFVNEEPFSSPNIYFDVNVQSHNRTSFFDCLETWFIENHGIIDLNNEYNECLRKWDEECKKIIENAFFKKSPVSQHEKMRDLVFSDSYKIFVFRYVSGTGQLKDTASYSLNEVMDIDNRLRAIGYQSTSKKLFAKSQRRLMTKELRRKIIERDNYTCQICGKYMPDEVGLHVDHIIPVRKGGTSLIH